MQPNNPVCVACVAERRLYWNAFAEALAEVVSQIQMEAIIERAEAIAVPPGCAGAPWLLPDRGEDS